MAHACDVVALVDTEGCEVYCPDCGDEKQHHPIFVDNEWELGDGAVCPDCRCVWSYDDSRWEPPDVDAGQALREVCSVVHR